MSRSQSLARRPGHVIFAKSESGPVSIPTVRCHRENAAEPYRNVIDQTVWARTEFNSL